MTKKLLRLGFYLLPLILFLMNFTEPRAAAISRPGPRSSTLPLNLRIFKTHGAQPLAAPGTPTALLGSQSARPSVQQVKAYVRTEAVRTGVDPQLALWIVKHESSFNPLARGDGDASRGLWQISKVYHPEVTDDQAFGVVSSTKWSLGQIRDGKVNEWSSYRNCKVLYANCPY